MVYYPIILEIALMDIQNGINYYNSIQSGLGEKFYKKVDDAINSLKFPHFQIRYNNIRCLRVKKFPFMLHFSVDDHTQTIYIHAVINTYLNPYKNWINQ